MVTKVAFLIKVYYTYPVFYSTSTPAFKENAGVTWANHRIRGGEQSRLQQMTNECWQGHEVGVTGAEAAG